MPLQHITCTICGKEENISLYRRLSHPLVAKMRKERKCFDCAYWETWLEMPEPQTIVISGALYKQTEIVEHPSIKKALNKSYVFLKGDRGAVYACKGLILRGTIPKHFKSQLKDQYKFITRQEYIRNRTCGGKMCLSKGCFDRYHCIWYYPEIAEAGGAWNKIPEDWVPGGEKCPSFVNKEQL